MRLHESKIILNNRLALAPYCSLKTKQYFEEFLTTRKKPCFLKWNVLTHAGNKEFTSQHKVII